MEDMKPRIKAYMRHVDPISLVFHTMETIYEEPNLAPDFLVNTKHVTQLIDPYWNFSVKHDNVTIFFHQEGILYRFFQDSMYKHKKYILIYNIGSKSLDKICASLKHNFNYEVTSWDAISCELDQTKHHIFAIHTTIKN